MDQALESQAFEKQENTPMLKKMMLLLAVVVASAGSFAHNSVRDIPQPTCWPCTSSLK